MTYPGQTPGFRAFGPPHHPLTPYAAHIWTQVPCLHIFDAINTHQVIANKELARGL